MNKEITDTIKVIAFPVLVGIIIYFLNAVMGDISNTAKKVDSIHEELSSIKAELKEVNIATIYNKDILDRQNDRIIRLEKKMDEITLTKKSLN